MNTSTCTVCGYNQLHRPPQDELICPCCGIQFGYHGFDCTHAQLRQEWIEKGALWHSKRTPAPSGWSLEAAFAQIVQAGLAPQLVAKLERPRLSAGPSLSVSETALVRRLFPAGFTLVVQELLKPVLTMLALPSVRIISLVFGVPRVSQFEAIIL